MIPKTAPKKVMEDRPDRLAVYHTHPTGELSVSRGAPIYGGKANGQEIEGQVRLVVSGRVV